MYYKTHRSKNYAPLFKSIVDEILADIPHHKQNFNERKNSPPVNIQETTEATIIEMAAPGLKKELFNLKTAEHKLVVSYKAEEEDTIEYTRREFIKKNFERSFKLNDKINTEAIGASYQDGILKITLPNKEQEPAPEARNIDVN